MPNIASITYALMEKTISNANAIVNVIFSIKNNKILNSILNLISYSNAQNYLK